MGVTNAPVSPDVACLPSSDKLIQGCEHEPVFFVYACTSYAQYKTKPALASAKLLQGYTLYMGEGSALAVACRGGSNQALTRAGFM